MHDLTGFTFGRLGVIQRQGSEGKRSTWLCVCVCKRERVVVGNSLTAGATQSCGCLRAEKAANRMRAAGLRARGKTERNAIIARIFGEDEEPPMVYEPAKKWRDAGNALRDLQRAMGYPLSRVQPAGRLIRYFDEQEAA